MSNGQPRLVGVAWPGDPGPSGPDFRIAQLAAELAQARDRERAAQRRADDLARANAALAREVEERRRTEQLARGESDVLARANAALRDGLDRLAGATADPQPLVRHLLFAACERVGAAGAALFRYDPGNHTLVMTMVARPGEPADPADAPALAPFATPVPADVSPYWQALVTARRPLLLDADDPAAAPMYWPGTRRWHLATGQTISVGVPLVVGDRPLGLLGLTFPPGTTAGGVGSDRLALAQAMAHQVTLALELTRLGEEARQAAVAREQERAARDRAAELAAAAHALRRTAAALAEKPELGTFLQQVLTEAARHARADFAGLFMLDDAGRAVALAAAVCDGAAVDVAADPRLAAVRRPVLIDGTAARQVLADGRPSVYRLPRDLADAPAAFRAFHAGLGHRHLLAVPVILGPQVIGCVSLCFARPDPPPAGQNMELLQALSHQTAVAVHLARLGEASRGAAVAEERNRLAREVHDALARSLTGIRMQLSAAAELTATRPDVARACIERAEALAQAGLREARRSVDALRASPDEYADLVGNLRSALHESTADTTVAAEMTVDGPAQAVPPDVGLQLLRVAQEAVANALRHATARRIVVTVAFAAGRVEVAVADDGIGFDPAAAAAAGGFGVAGMRKRVEQVGGTLVLTSAAGAGTRVVAAAPLTARAVPRP
jgi:signal transduction histidine kinase